MSQISQKAA